MRLTHRRLLSLLATPAILAAAAIGVQATSHAQGGTAAVKLAPAHILVTPKGFTLYIFSPDSKNKSTCYGPCAKFWPPLLVPKGTQPTASMPGVPGTFGMAVRTDGTHQLTYQGAPLYTFLNDKSAGAMNGQGLIALGGSWWVVVAGK
jgi:predicted lipoprotein with Yx(FWY)xxD motif